MSNDATGVAGSQAGTRERFTFAKVPNAMVADPDLKSSDVRVAALIIPWLGKGSTCWVTVGHLARGAGIKSRAVWDCVDRLKAGLWFATEPSPGNKTGRRFVALWRTEAGFLALANRMGVSAERAASAFTEEGVACLRRHHPGIVLPVIGEDAESSLKHSSYQPSSEEAPVHDFNVVVDEFASAFYDEPETAVAFRRAAVAIKAISCLSRSVPGYKAARDRTAAMMADLLGEYGSPAACKKCLDIVQGGSVTAEHATWALRTTMLKCVAGIDKPGAYFSTLFYGKRVSDDEVEQEWARQRKSPMEVAW